MKRINAEVKKKFDIYKPRRVYNKVTGKIDYIPLRVLDLKQMNSFCGFEVFIKN